MVLVVGLEEGFDLFREEGEEIFGIWGGHEGAWNGDFGLGQGEGCVTV